MADISPSALAALAKTHLSLPPDTPDIRVPRFYLDELRRHLTLLPNERDFRVTLTPGAGYGSAICLKDGCGMEIELTRGTRLSDGGKRVGFGSLSSLRNHFTSAYHKGQVVKHEEGDAMSSTNTPSSSEAMKAGPSSRKSLPSSFSSTTARPSTPVAPSHSAVSLKTERNLVRVKPEPTENLLPQKRLSDVAFDPTNTEEAAKDSSSAASSSKKVKREPSAKTPFATVTNAPVAGSSQVGAMEWGNLPSDYSAGTYYDTEDPMLRLDDVRLAIAGQQSVLDSIRLRPGGPTQYDYHRINECQQELARLLPLEQHYSALVASLSAAGVYNQAPIAKAEPVIDQYPLMRARGRQSLDRMSAQIPPAPSFPEPMDVDEKPFPFPQAFASTSQAPYIPVYPAIPQAPVPYALPPPPQAPPAFKYEPEEHKPFVQNGFPAASGSRAPPPPSSSSGSSPARFPGRYDSEPYESDASSRPGMADFQTKVENIVDRVGINVRAMNDDAFDDNGDFHGRGRDLFVGPQAKPDDLEHFIKEASNAETFDKGGSVEKGLAELGLSDLDDKLPGMEVSLMKHQVLGVSWMLKKEQSNLMGGCLADEMGLGKTVQMIACMVMNRSKDKARKTTLILAPTALLDQWKAEIESKTNCDLKVLIYHGSSKTKRKSELLKYDIVLTTYHTMSLEWPDYENEMKKKAKARKSGDDFIVPDSDEEDMKDASYRATKRKQQAGLLFQVEFFRVIADEAQNIRNRRTRMSRSISDLQATYRWCLTGTPIVNTLADVYGLLRFLRIRPWYDWAAFHKEIGLLEKKRPNVAVARLQSIMNTFLLRRKKDSMLDGEILVNLPPKKVELIKLEFSEEEREIYNMVEARSQAKFNRYLREGTVLKNYHQVLVLLLRLRQVCSHPCLIQEGNGKAFVRPDEAKVKAEVATELTRARRLVSAEFVIDMKRKFLENALARMQAEKESANATIEEEDCPICYDAMTDAVITSCKHIFCRECIIDHLNQPAVEGAEHRPDQRPCPVCRSLLTEDTLFSRQAFEPTAKELNPTALQEDEDHKMSDIEEFLPGGKGKASTSTKPRRSGRSRHRRVVSESDDEGDDVLRSDSEDDYDDDEDNLSDFIVQSDEEEEEKDARRAMNKRQGKKRAHIIIDSDDEPDTPEEKEVIFGVPRKVPTKEKMVMTMSRFLPSTKMKYMMEQLQKLVKAKPDEKTLIVSQWTGCLSLVSDYLTEKGIPHVKYQGDMSRTQRERAVQVFMSKEKARVMLMSLKCGGVGLNLTRANNVISLDLGWSQAVEAQAFDRVHRVGQVRDVLVQRVVIADTVENRILDMQNRKQDLADGSLGEGSGKKIGKLSVKELANLFNLDTNGRLLRQ
ncbi:hypothetical protein CVT26_010649 [Gymnopilus dilepis]|uniref:Uncharacterized protein n=1 Tax=Gymnopilus dilepis TaxID=231916 RepID=A0A409VI90_9AGAR|nr:hypothetical protein CVT26_010649 [Gymnopilus dilepis]